MTETTTKRFDRVQYDAEDSAKMQVLQYLRSRNCIAKVNEDDFAVDILAEKNHHLYAVEVEIKHDWHDEAFPFTTLHIAYRKNKFLHDTRSVYFFVLNHQRTHALVVNGNVVRQARRIVKQTMHTNAEEFFEIPIEQARLVTL